MIQKRLRHSRYQEYRHRFPRWKRNQDDHLHPDKEWWLYPDGKAFCRSNTIGWREMYVRYGTRLTRSGIYDSNPFDEILKGH